MPSQIIEGIRAQFFASLGITENTPIVDEAVQRNYAEQEHQQQKASDRLDGPDRFHDSGWAGMTWSPSVTSASFQPGTRLAMPGPGQPKQAASRPLTRW